jgi:hypothetical protein
VELRRDRRSGTADRVTARGKERKQVHAPVALWSGEVPAKSGVSRILRLDLAERRPIAALRVVLDTRRVAGWNEIDAIGIVPADPVE